MSETTQYRAVLHDNDDPDYEVTLRIHSTSVVCAAIQADAQCDADWENMHLVLVEEVNAIRL